ncbi:hypothetical protein BY996DRAFT_7257980, partial [Phakopsora pachyrhizi]
MSIVNYTFLSLSLSKLLSYIYSYICKSSSCLLVYSFFFKKRKAFLLSLYLPFVPFVCVCVCVLQTN